MTIQLISVKEAADALKIKESTFRTWLQRGEIPKEIIFSIGKNIRVRTKKFEDWVNGNECI